MGVLKIKTKNGYIPVGGASNESADLTGYATESWVQDNYQEKGNYLTEHQDISGKLDTDKLPEAINEALAQAKESGKFDGDDYILTEADKTEIAEMTADLIDVSGSDEIYVLGDGETIEDAPTDAVMVISPDGYVDIPSSGGNVDLTGVVKSVNGIAPDENGNVEIAVSGGNGVVSPLRGKKLSIIGDSISTFSGYIPDGYKTWYPKNYVDTVEKTWWYQLIQKTGMVLCKNASWAESTLCGNTENASGIVGCSDARVEAASGEDEPDVIIVFIGINDFAKNNGYSCGNYDGSSGVTANATQTSITDAYGLLLSKLRQRYPKAFVCGCRIMPEKYSGGSMNASFSGGFPNINPDDSVSLPALNEQIEKICKAFGCGIIPMDACGVSFYNVSELTGDGLHPNAELMERMALIAEKWICQYVDESMVSGDSGTSHVHSYTSSVTTAATCETAGVRTYICSCGDSYTKEIPAIGHNYVGGVCTVCGADNGNLLYNWDFTNSLVDTVNGAQAALVFGNKTKNAATAPPVRDSEGVHFTGGAQAIDFGSIFALNRTYEIDVAEMDYKGESDKNVRFFLLRMNEGSSASGVTYHAGNWNVYSGDWGTGYSLTSQNDISGKTVTLKIDSYGCCELLLDGISYGVGGVLFTSGWDVLELGSSGVEDADTNAAGIGCTLYDCTITGFRIYDGVYDNNTGIWRSVEYTEGDGYYNDSGNLVAFNGVYNTGQVAVNNATAIRFTATQANSHYVVFWDSNKNFIVSRKTTTAETFTFDVPIGAAYFSVAYYTAERDTINVQVCS